MAADRTDLCHLSYICGVLAVCFAGFCWCQEVKTVSVFENADVGTAVVNIPLLFSITVRVPTENLKAELPCSVLDGDRYGRFAVNENCTLVVNNPLDYSVQSEYVLKVLISGRVHREVKVRLQVHDVVGYPPVYNITCETPTVKQNGERGTFLFQAGLQVEGVTSDGDVLSAKVRFPKPNWDPGDPLPSDHPQLIVNTDNGDCTVDLFWAVYQAIDEAIVDKLWLTKVHSITCFSGPASDRNSSVFMINLIDKEANYDPRLSYVRENVPDSWMESDFQKYIVYSSLTTMSGDQRRFVCQLPETMPSIKIRQSLMTVDIVAINYVWAEIKPVGCPRGRYGWACQNICICRNGAYCHAFNGACKCQQGWTGVACDIPKDTVSVVATPSDPRDLYISGNVTLRCEVYDVDVVTTSWIFPDGSAKTTTGADGTEITISDIKTTDNGPYICQVNDSRGDVFKTDVVLNVDSCPPDRTGQHCEDVCGCRHGASCDRWAGCVCPAGWTGRRCQTACPQGTYGYGCRETCECENGVCLPSDGVCNCTEGWFGQDCSKPCLPGRYGWSCHQICTCKNNATCHHMDGTCKCTPPWTGPTCEVLAADYPRNDAPLTYFVVLALVVMFGLILLAMLYKKRRGTCRAGDRREPRLLLELELQRLEEDVTEALQPGWLKRWERKPNYLSPGIMIGMGMFGYVRRSQLRTPEGEVTVAAKSVRTEDAQCYRDFCRETAILVTVHEDKDHIASESNIIQLLGLITQSPEKFILLEYAPGGDLLNLLRGHELECRVFNEVVRLLRYAEHVSSALKELQRLRIAHRDVAARNVLITRGDVAKLADFGSARDVYTTTQYVPADGQGNVPVPLKWMALESLESRKYTCQSDVWSFGVFLWEIATLGDEPHYDGRLHLTCPELVGLLRQGVRLDIPRECPTDLYGIMASCWAADPSARPSPETLIELINKVRMDSCLLVEFETSV